MMSLTSSSGFTWLLSSLENILPYSVLVCSNLHSAMKAPVNSVFSSLESLKALDKLCSRFYTIWSNSFSLTTVKL